VLGSLHLIIVNVVYVIFNTKKLIAYGKSIYNIKLIHESLYKHIQILNNSIAYGKSIYNIKLIHESLYKHIQILTML
jgi:hypothetical protein